MNCPNLSDDLPTAVPVFIIGSSGKEVCHIKTFDFEYKVISRPSKTRYRTHNNGIIEYYEDRTVTLYVDYDGTVRVFWTEGLPYSDESLEQYLTEYQTPLTKKSQLAKKLCREAKHNVPLTMGDVQALKRKAKQIIPARTEYYARIMNTSYSKITIRCQTSLWGSCNCETNTLSFNAVMMLLPEEVLDLVICHELAHTLVPDHSPEFWQTVEKFYPDCKKWNDWLDQYGWWYLLIYPEEIRQHRVSKARKKG